MESESEEEKEDLRKPKVIHFDRDSETQYNFLSASDSEAPKKAQNNNEVSILNYTIDEFIQVQMEDLEKIGISGELFKDVW